MDKSREVIIIGGGAGGVKTALELRLLGFEGKIRLFEDRFLGGECTNVGCIPSKTFYNFAKLYYKSKKLLNQTLSINLQNIANTVKRVVNTIRKGIEYNLRKADIEILYQKPSIRKDKIVIEGREYNFDVVVIATGSSPIKLFDNKLKESEKILTNRELWGKNLENFIQEASKNRKILIVGGGFIGIEIATMFSTLFDSSYFVVIEKEKNIIPTADEEVINEIQKLILKSNPNLKIITNNLIKDISMSNEKLIIEYDNQKEEFDFVIFSAGRKINNPVEDTDSIKVDEFLRVSGYENVWAVGDVTGGKMLAHKAEFQAKIVAKNILNYLLNKEPKEKYTLTHEVQIPSIMFSIPEVGWYGLTENQLKEMGIEYNVKKISMAANPRAIADGSREGFVKLIYNNKGEILGVHIIAENVSELINIPMVYNSETIVFPHPTLSEIFTDLL